LDTLYSQIQSPNLAVFLKLLNSSSRSSCAVSFFNSTMTCSLCVSRSMSKNTSLELSTRTERTLPDAVRPCLKRSRTAHTHHSHNLRLRLLDAFVLCVEVSDRDWLSIWGMMQPRMVVIEWLYSPQLFQPLLLLNIVRSSVVVRSHCLCEASLDGEVRAGMFGSYCSG
jgi:hypothetical protein